MMDVLPPTGTILDALVTALQRSVVFNRNVMSPPACVLWPDEPQQWLPLVRVLRDRLPCLVTLGKYTPTERMGPAVWIRCLLARQLEAASWPLGTPPIIYLPGVARSKLRDVENCPSELQPLVELQYRGVFFSQPHGRDWTLMAFLRSSEGGLGLDVAQDAETLEALGRAAPLLAQTPVASLCGRELDAAEFDQLLVSDPIRDLLRWLDDPSGTRARWDKDQWGAFCSRCRDTLDFDPQTAGELVGADHLGRKQGPWKAVWQRFAESPRSYPGLPALLARAEPASPGLFEAGDRSSWPGVNAVREKELRTELVRLEELSPVAAAQKLKDLEASHGERREWVWAELGQAPLARALQHLAGLATNALPVAGSKPSELAEAYVREAWQCDAAVLRALECVERAEDLAAVRTGIRTVYLPWLAKTAERLQQLVEQQGYPGHASGNLAGVMGAEKQCVLFADGLRLDIGHMLVNALQRCGLNAVLSPRWAALPSVTATCKPAVSPVSAEVRGNPEDPEFLPRTASTDEPLLPHRFRKLLEDAGYQILDRDATGDGSGRGWSEQGDLDHHGHQEGYKLARRVGELLRELVERIETLLQAGWKKVVVVTDHGWLLVPGGLPKTQLPNFLAASRWGRCATLKPSAHVELLVVPWRWSSEVCIALAPNVSCFVEGKEYSHGGLSLQECVVPVVEVSRPAVKVTPKFKEVVWRGMRCRVRADGATTGAVADLRTQPANPQSTLCAGGRPLDADGCTSLLVENDGLEGTAVFAVIVGPGGELLAKQLTPVGGGES